MPFVPDSNQTEIGRFVPDQLVNQPSDYDIFRQQYIAQQQRPTLTKAIEQLTNPIKGAAGMVGDIAGIPNGLFQASQSQTPIATTGRSLLEGARQSGVDIVNLIRNLPEMAGPVLNPVQGAIQLSNLRSRTPLEEEIQKAFQEQQLQQNVMRPENQLIQGEVSPNLVQGTRQAIPLAIPLVGAEARTALSGGLSKLASGVSSSPLSQAISNTVKGTGNVISGTTKSIVKSILPQSVETQFVDALNPGSNPIQYQKAVKAAKTVLPDIQDVIDRSGVNFDSAAGARDVSSFAKNDIWSQIEQQTGQPIFADATPVADAFISVANNPVIKRLFPESIPNLEAEAAKYSGQQIPIQELEGIKQTFNALNQTKETISKSKKAALQKTDPIYAATDLANQAIGDILESKFGPEFTNQKLQYGAWKQINDLANKQAIKQEILNNKITPFEGLGILGAIAEGMANEGSLVRGAGTALAGKALKYVNSPDAKFSTLSRKLPNP